MYIQPLSVSQPAYSYDENQIYVVPIRRQESRWRRGPNWSRQRRSYWIKVEFRNLPASRGTFDLHACGDLVKELPFDGTTGIGTVRWDLVSRNLQDVASGVFLYSVECEDEASTVSSASSS